MALLSNKEEQPLRGNAINGKSKILKSTMEQWRFTHQTAIVLKCSTSSFRSHDMFDEFDIINDVENEKHFIPCRYFISLDYIC